MFGRVTRLRILTSENLKKFLLFQIMTGILMAKGKVYLVGTGPGDPELITMKGYQLIKDADVLLYDHLIPPELLGLPKPQAELIAVGKFASKHTLPQEEINKLIIKKAKENKLVVRLKGGDPYMFGRGGEEAEDCFDAGVEFEVVPGVTSALAAPGYAGIPPTHRDCTPNVAIVTGHRKEGYELDIPKAGTVIFLMGVKNIGKIIDTLLKDGWDKSTKIAAIEHGTFYDQRVIKGTLENFLDIVEKAKLRTPAIFIAGKVVEMQEKLDWFSKKQKVLVLGTHPEKYKYLGTVVHRQIIKCVGLDDYSKTDDAIKKLNDFDWMVFTSVNGAKYFLQRLNAAGLDARALANLKIAAIGKTTAARLADFGLLPNLVPEDESSAGLLEEFKKLDINGKNFILPQAEVSSKVLPQGLTEAGATVDAVSVYKTVEIEPASVEMDFIDIIVFTSGSTVKAFIKKFGAVPDHIKAYCLGPPTLNTAKENNINAELIPKNDS